MQGRHITNEKVTEYIDGLYFPLSEEMGAFREESEEAGIPIILRDTERFLSVIARMIGAKNVLEVGTAVGYSACCFAGICGPGSRVVTLERDEGMISRALENIRRFGYEDRITVVPGDAAESIREIEGIFDLVFIDGAKSHYREYWDGALEHCRRGSVIVCDNVLMRGAVASEEYDSSARKHRTSLRRMRNFLKYITENDRADTSVLAAGDGVSVSFVR